MAPVGAYRRRSTDYEESVTNRDLYNEIRKLDDRVAKVESKISYIFGGFAVITTIIAGLELLSHHFQ